MLDFVFIQVFKSIGCSLSHGIMVEQFPVESILCYILHSKQFACLLTEVRGFQSQILVIDLFNGSIANLL